MVNKNLHEFDKAIQFGINLSIQIRSKVMPVFGIKQKDVPINKISKDFNYKVDIVAEEAIKKAFAKLWENGIYYGYVTENQGFVLPSNNSPEIIFMIDPIDGSRPAQIGAEMVCVTMVAVKGNKKDAAFSDIEFGITLAIKENRIFLSEKGKGVFEIIEKKTVQLQKRKNISAKLKDSTLVYETYSMSPTYTGIVIEPLVKEISFKTEYPSGSYSALTLVRGQNEIHVDVRKRLIEQFPKLPIALKSNSKSVFPMDIAAGFLMIRELGGKVTDGYGKRLDKVKLWEFDKNGSWASDNEISIIGSISPHLHKLTLGKIEEGFKNLNKL